MREALKWIAQVRLKNILIGQIGVSRPTLLNKCIVKPNGIELLEKKFIEKFNNTKFDFSNAVYVNNYTKICIKCKKCGAVLNVFPKEILKRGIFCNTCDKKKKEKAFIESAKKLHNDFYTYENVHFTLSKEKVNITCPIHGSFYQTPEVHLLGHGCPICNGVLKYDKEDFIALANKIHNNYYNYSEVDYKGSTNKVKIICPKHGEFYQRADYHLRRW